MKYTVLEQTLWPVADATQVFIEGRFSVKNPRIEEPIHSKVEWQPTFAWQTRTGYICCEVSLTPYRPVIETAFAQIVRIGIPIRGFIAYPSGEALLQQDYTIRDYKAHVDRTVGYGFGLIAVDDASSCKVEHLPVSIPLFIPEPDLSGLRKPLRTPVKDAYDTYINGDPASGLQKIGQLVEDAMVDLAEQAYNKNKLTLNKYKPGKYFPQGKLIVAMISQNVIDAGVLGRCRGFSDDRGNVSHKPRNIAEAKRIESGLRDCFVNGVRILVELPVAFQKAGFKFQV